MLPRRCPVGDRNSWPMSNADIRWECIWMFNQSQEPQHAVAHAVIP